MSVCSFPDKVNESQRSLAMDYCRRQLTSLHFLASMKRSIESEVLLQATAGGIVRSALSSCAQLSLGKVNEGRIPIESAKWNIKPLSQGKTGLVCVSQLQ